MRYCVVVTERTGILRLVPCGGAGEVATAVDLPGTLLHTDCTDKDSSFSKAYLEQYLAAHEETTSGHSSKYLECFKLQTRRRKSGTVVAKSAFSRVGL